MTQYKKRKHGKTSQETQSSVTKLFKKFGKPSGSSSSERQNLLKQNNSHACECEAPASGQKAKQKDDCLPKTDDTFSCTSCALMNLLTSDPPKLLFLFSIVCVFVLILLALNSCSLYKDPSVKLLDEKRERRSNGEWMEDDRMSWETSTSTLLNGPPELLASDSGGFNAHDGNMDNPSIELSNILDPVKVSAAYSSNSLRDFYRKLLRTDIHIKKLRTCLNNLKREKTNNFFDFNPLRKKRSLKINRNATRKLAKRPFLHKRSVKHFKKYDPPRFATRADNDIYKDMKENPDIYATSDPNLASENTKDTFTSLKDSQAFQHLDRKMQTAIRLFNKQFPETTPKMLVSIINSKENHEFQPDIYLKYNPVNARKEKPHNDERNDPPAIINPYRISQEEIGVKDPYLFGQNFEHKQTVFDSKIDDMTKVDNALVQTETNPPEQTNEFTVTLASITSVKPGSKLRKEQADHNQYFPKRRLLQHNDNDNEDNDDEDDDRDADYEDQTKEPWDREKRSITPIELGIKYKSDQPRALSTMDNPYWKGPVPLYHDELDQMIKAALEMASHKPSTRKKEKIKSNPIIGTHGYTAQYTKENYDKLAAMAQAYSDYGVLDGKKEIVENNRRQENTVNLMMSQKKHEMPQSKTGNDVFFRKVALIKYVKVVPNDRIPEKNSKNLPMIHKDKKTGARQDITDAKRLEELNTPNMYDHHTIYKRCLKSVETEVPNNEASADSNIKSDVNDTMKLSVIENSYLKDKYLFVTSTENNKIANSSKIEDSDALNKIGNRTVVKRSANGFIRSWNDLYDDEYGVKDPLENEMKDKSSVKYNDLIAKSENWLGAKFRQIANNMKERKSHWKQRMVKNQNFKYSRNKSNFTKRAVDNADKNSGKQTFKALTANMKKVIHEAAEAIRETTNREARSDNVQAATMMQRLVGLMSELVDIQVKQKTCVQLPEDLRSFLAWLTTPNPQENNDINSPADSTYDAGSVTKNFLKTDYDMMTSNARNECLGTIHDIQDLIEQYDEMSEEDKSKMSGVREYLEDQLKFLHKQLSSFNEYEVPVTYQERSIRKRRQLSRSLNEKTPLKRNTHSYHNYFDRKRTKSTVHDGVMEEVTQNYYITNNRKNDLDKVNGRNENENIIKKGHDAGETELKHLEDNVIQNKDENEKTALNIKGIHGNNIKRNLQDVYYNALAMAKANATTVKFT